MTVPETAQGRPRVWPADYYSAPSPSPAVPQWLTYGCGGGSILVLILVFAGGAWLSTGGMVDFMDLAIGMSVGEMRGMYASDVTPQRKESLEAAISEMQKGLREKKVRVVALQPFLERLRKAVADEKVTGAEAAGLEDAARTAARRASR